MSTAQGLELLGTIVGILVAIGSGITVWVKLNAQIAVLQDRSDHENRESNDRDSHESDRDELVDELRRQLTEQADEIKQLRRDLNEERASREADNRRSSREINDLRDEVSSLKTRLMIARQQRGDAS